MMPNVFSLRREVGNNWDENPQNTSLENGSKSAKNDVLLFPVVLPERRAGHFL